MSSQWIQSTTAEDFRRDVMDRSQEVPVVVDFWAEWCQPCRQLMPILEKLADEFAGRFVLVKINVDEQPELAGAFGVQSIPFVVAMIDGQPVSQLPGVLPEAQLRQWLESFVPSPAMEAYEAGLLSEAEDDPMAAEQQFRKASELEPDHAAFRIALARVLLRLDREQECSEILEKLEARGFLEPEAQQLKEQLAMKSEVEESGGTQAARTAFEADPQNMEKQILYAEALSIDKRYSDACDQLLDIISKDRTELRERAKDAMVTILSAMGPKSQLASDYRRKLATLFY
ncbi:MAG: thioredoxin [Planctomycetaceae bacterium]